MNDTNSAFCDVNTEQQQQRNENRAGKIFRDTPKKLTHLFVDMKYGNKQNLILKREIGNLF